jgi:pyruvate formate lyase activating enzyme
MQVIYPDADLKLDEVLARYTAPGEIYERLEDDRVRCYSCGHRCLIPEGRAGICKVRFNHQGELRVPHGYVAALNVDPIEKKPFFHAMPGTEALSFGMLGCDYHCAYCQNWQTSQAIRDVMAGTPIRLTGAQELVDMALLRGASTVTSTYNEPLITSEWAVEVFKLARQHNLLCSYVSNGNGTPEVLEYIRPWMELYKIDLKCFRDKNYRKLGGTLEAVLDTIRQVRQMGLWLEIVTLVVPKLNDSAEELRDMAKFIASVSPEIPWHLTAFHEDYKMRGNGRTQLQTLLHAAEMGKEEGLQFVYVGNLPGYAPDWENTHCPKCGELLIERYGFRVLKYRLKDGTCCKCGHGIPGVWKK